MIPTINIIQVKNVPVSMDPNQPAAMKRSDLVKNIDPEFISGIAPNDFFEHESELYKVIHITFNFDAIQRLVYVTKEFTSRIGVGPDTKGYITFVNLTQHFARWTPAAH